MAAAVVLMGNAGRLFSLRLVLHSDCFGLGCRDFLLDIVGDGHLATCL